ncbi:hypothetical protein EST38_g5459 [Candolleomyces aberdarensis]|uniref:Uncharacterized protein n=1 Tax=Candolleomyces aberdarensis TaxID=2316362 RepID=A0A4Q2DN60_9AGAR|nr:hypothetical protein EST38_g5459 [Candolleomyces aberdarensis]
MFFGAWATLITVLNNQGHKIYIDPPLLTVLGTVLGFVISYRTTSSFERYNEGRRLWSQIIIASRTFARLVWFHVPDPVGETPAETADLKARAMVEKKSTINLLEAFAVAVKHYLRGEDGIYYKDLYYLVKFLPAYALPPGLPSQTDLFEGIEVEPSSPVPSGYEGGASKEGEDDEENVLTSPIRPSESSHSIHQRISTSQQHVTLPMPITSPTKSTRTRRTSFAATVMSPKSNKSFLGDKKRSVIPAEEEAALFPASMPPKYTIFDLFPFSLLIGFVSNRGHEVKGKRAARIRMKLLQKTVSHNLPLELTLYMSSYIASLQQRKLTDVPTTNALFAALAQLGDSLSGLERILTTPVPFSYSIHLWAVTIIYCLALPLQIWEPLQWVTIPATVIVSFIFFGFLVAGEEIENPFGYDKNDLNLDHFTSKIIRNELKAITSTPPPDPAKWAFAPENNLVFSHGTDVHERISPDEWVARGPGAIMGSLSHF